MTSTFTTTFTRTNAKHLAAKVITDLYQCSMFYGRPPEDRIEEYETELIEMLANEYVSSYEFGFKRDGKRVLTWYYTVGVDGGLHGDSNAGAIYAKAAVADVAYFNFMMYSDKWSKLTEIQRTNFKTSLPFQRTAGAAPADGNGYWRTDHGYSAGGVRIQRKTFRPR
jgi:hypothetical protein